MAIIEVSSVGKRYRIFYEKSSLVKTFFAWTQGRRIYEDLWALKNISFTIERGETIGIIGKNGAGKTTLLKILSGVTRSESGTIRIDGLVSALLELGTGFQEELTGRENIFLNGSILGMKRKEITKKFDNIVDFADIGKFIDSPMRTYSTGMWMRLGFALAINANFEVLLIDEILAVGDIAFQKKCLEKFNELKQNGITILFVSHNLDMVKGICNRTIWLDSGYIRAFDATPMVTNMYLENIDRGSETFSGISEKIDEKTIVRKQWGSKEVEITDVFFTDTNGNKKESFYTDEPFTINIAYSAKKIINNPIFGFGIHRQDGLHVCGPNTKAYDFRIDHIKGKGMVKFLFEKISLLEGCYNVSASIYDNDIYHPYDHHEQLYRFFITPNKKEERYGLLKPIGRWSHEK